MLDATVRVVGPDGPEDTVGTVVMVGTSVGTIVGTGTSTSSIAPGDVGDGTTVGTGMSVGEEGGNTPCDVVPWVLAFNIGKSIPSSCGTGDVGDGRFFDSSGISNPS